MPYALRSAFEGSANRTAENQGSFPDHDACGTGGKERRRPVTGSSAITAGGPSCKGKRSLPAEKSLLAFCTHLKVIVAIFLPAIIIRTMCRVALSKRKGRDPVR